MLSRTQRSAIFTSYNRQRAAGDVERGRLNRALGLAQSGEERPYETTAESCTCPDWRFNASKTGGQCKHMLALSLENPDGPAIAPAKPRRRPLPAIIPNGGIMTNLPATTNFAPRLDVDGNAPPLKVDVYNPHLTLDDVLPDNFISMEGLQRWLDERNADSRVLTTTAVTMEMLYDPGRGEKPADGEWKPVLWFEETESGLVINKTRGQQLSDLAGSPLLVRWARIGKVALKVGVFNGKAQVGVVAIPADNEPAGDKPGNGKGRNGIDALR